MGRSGPHGLAESKSTVPAARGEHARPARSFPPKRHEPAPPVAVLPWVGPLRPSRAKLGGKRGERERVGWQTGRSGRCGERRSWPVGGARRPAGERAGMGSGTWRKAVGALKDSTKVGLANFNSEYKVTDHPLLPLLLLIATFPSQFASKFLEFVPRRNWTSPS